MKIEELREELKFFESYKVEYKILSDALSELEAAREVVKMVKVFKRINSNAHVKEGEPLFKCTCTACYVLESKIAAYDKATK